MKTLMADPNFQSHARRIANVLMTSQSTDGGSSLAEVGRSGSGVAFRPRSLFKPVASRPAASQHLRTAFDTSVQPLTSTKGIRSKGAVMSAGEMVDELSKGAAALIAVAVAFHSEAGEGTWTS